MSDDLLVFLNARLGEDEAAARFAGEGEWRTGCTCEGECPGYPSCERIEGDDITIYSEGGHDANQAEHIARHDPARVLREVEAKRRIIAAIAQGVAYEAEPLADMTLLLLALPYDSHPDYRPEWVS